MDVEFQRIWKEQSCPISWLYSAVCLEGLRKTRLVSAVVEIQTGYLPYRS